MNFGGSLLSSVLKILVTAATLALVYFLIIKPVLHTTETISKNTNSSIENAMNSVNDAFDTSGNGNMRVQRRITTSIKTTKPGAQDAAVACINRVQPDVQKIERCAKKFGLIP